MTYGTPPPSGHGCCDVDAIDELTCKAAGIKRQAAVTDESLQTLTPFRAALATAKTDYCKARATAKPDVKTAEDQVKAVRETLRCRLDEEQRECVERAVHKVWTRIEECVGEPGCREYTCDFPTEGHQGDPAPKLAGLIAHYREEVSAASKYFTDVLQAELTALPKRAAQLKADATQLTHDAADPAQPPVDLYVRLLVLDRQVKGVWNGFPGVHDYVDCLCRTLMFILRGWEAVVILEGWLAVRACKDKAHDDQCKHLLEHTVDEVRAEVAKCPPGDCGSC
ncbi:hypothetical protein [Streptomyces sp. NRRL WC-3742]|uniref:hypothetical protein n=1 Tax=Streptomyces sp. NRRL WC-3742 TaxID=1463934 RepID=UPI0004C69D31|nr:hypothetical protein [Streptomyces sp. NRRL WC-3742]